MASAAELVNQSFAIAQNYANTAQQALTGFTDALNTSIYAPPTLSVTWNSLAAPTLPSLPSVPTMPTIAFAAPTAPGEWALAEPTITVDDFTELAPTLDLPIAPTVSYGTAPTIPSITDVTIPDAPTLAAVAVPTYLGLSTPTFGGVDLHTDYLTKLENIPTLDLVAPTPYSYALGQEYASTLLSNLKATLNNRLSGGTGLPAAVEQAIWDRARSRETQSALANEAEVMRTSEAMGFQLPSGVLAAQLREAQQAYYDKLSGLSRDVAIKQAELEQENLKQTIAAGMDLEGKLIDYSLKLEQIAFDSAKTAADNAIQSYNAQVEQFKALLSAYNTYAVAYKTIMDAELSKVEVYKAELQAEQTKAQVNNSLVQQYKAQIEAGLAYVEIYKAQVGAANTLIQLEQAKIGAAGEQIRAYVAQVNAETSKVEAYKAGVQAEATKVEVYRVKAQAFSAKTGAQAEKARAEISRYTALAQAKEAQWRGYTAQVEAERSRIAALGTQSTALLEGYKAGAAAVETEAGMHTKVWETQIRQYEASQNIAIQAAKINGDFTIQTNNARLDAAKAGTQVYAQLTSSAYGMMHTSAGISGTASMSVGYSYGGDVTGTVSPLTSIG
jgi:hypothetical protein